MKVPLKTQLLLSFLLVLSLTVSMSVAFYLTTSRAMRYEELASLSTSQLIELQRLKSGIDRQFKQLADFILFQQEEDLEELEEAAKEVGAAFENLQRMVGNEIGSLDELEEEEDRDEEEEEREAFEQLESIFAEIEDRRNRIISLSRAGKTQQAVGLFEEIAEQQYDEQLADVIDELVSEEVEETEERKSEMKEGSRQSNIIAIAGCLLAFGIVSFSSLVLFGSINQINRAERERELLNKKLRRASERAEAANLAKSKFLANMSHEIRTPLNSIFGFTDLLRRGMGTQEEQRTYLDTVYSSGQHLLALIDDILDLTKIEEGHMAFEQTPFSPHQIISDVVSVLRVPAQEKQIGLEWEWKSRIPETIVTDPGRLKQLLINLVGNAVKFTKHGGVRIVACVFPDAPEPRLQIEVHDSGIGIQEEQIERIFSPFKQADNSVTRQFGGTGLGLAISRHIARELGGDITAESEPGRGSIFRVTLATGPLEGVRLLDSPPAEAVRPGHQLAKQIPASLPSARILLVEDGESNRELIRVVLEEAGAEVVCAENGQEGLDAAGQGRFDLILMDMQMPVLDGYAATRRLRDRGETLPIIALTAHAMRGDREKCLSAGCSGYLTKPIDIDELLKTVAQELGQRKETHIREAETAAEQRSNRQTEVLSPITSTLLADRPHYRPIVENFIALLAERMDSIQAAFDTQDWNKVAESAHWLKGAGGTVGFSCFTEPAMQVERMAKEGRPDQVERGIRELRSLASRVTVLDDADRPELGHSPSQRMRSETAAGPRAKRG